MGVWREQPYSPKAKEGALSVGYGQSSPSGRDRDRTSSHVALVVRLPDSRPHPFVVRQRCSIVIGLGTAEYCTHAVS